LLLFGRSLYLTKHFLQFFDSVVYGVGTDPPTSLAQLNSKLFSCTYSVTALYELSKHAFNIEELKTNAAFYYFHLSSVFTASSPLLKDLKKLEVQAKPINMT
jgi:hypothetical protein